MDSPRLNFIGPSSSRLQLLQVGTLAAVLGCVVMGSALIFGSGRNGGTASLVDAIASASAQTAPTATAKPKAISEHAAVGAANSISGDSVRYYEQASGKAFAVSLATLRTDILSDKRLPGFIDSSWAPHTESVVSSFQTPTGIEHRLYDYATGESVVVGASLASLAVSPDGKQLAHLKEEGSGFALTVAGIDGAHPRTLMITRATEPRLLWRTADSISLVSRRADRPGYDLSLVDMSGNLSFVLTNKENLEFTWSPDGLHLLYSFFAADKGVSLWYRDIIAGTEVALNTATSAGKCSWFTHRFAVVCGIPVKTSLTRDVPADRTATIDDVVILDFDRGSRQRIYGGVNSTLIGVTKPFVSSTDSAAIFTNMFDGKLYMLPL